MLCECYRKAEASLNRCGNIEKIEETFGIGVTEEGKHRNWQRESWGNDEIGEHDSSYAAYSL